MATLPSQRAVLSFHGNGRVAPPKEGELTDLYFTHFAEGSFMPLLVNRFVFSMVPAQAPFFLRPLLRPIFSIIDAKLVANPLNASLKHIEETLEKSPTGWFAGGPNPTVADYMMSFGLDAIVERRPDLAGPNTKAWVERVHERPAYKRVSAYVDGEQQGAKL